MYTNYLYGVWDLDGVLFDPTHRIEYARNKDWEGFHSRCEGDAVREAEMALLKAWCKQPLHGAILITARMEKFQPETIRKLSSHGVPYHKLYMRREGDGGPAKNMKSRILNHLQDEFKLKISFIFEDNPRTIALLRSQGFTVFQTQEEMK